MRSLFATLAAATLTTVMPAAAAQTEDKATDRTEAANRALVQNAFARWANGEFDIFDLLVDDVTWHIAGYDPDVARTYRSRQALLEATSQPLRARLTGPLQPTVRRIWTSGDDVIVQWDGVAPLYDGSTYRNTYLWIMTLRDERVVAVTAFLDNAAFKAALAKPLPANSKAQD